MLGALSQTKTPAGPKILLKIASSDSEEASSEIRYEAIMNLGISDNPHAEAAHFLINESHNNQSALRDVSILALGNISKRLSNQDYHIKDKSEEHLKQLYNDSFTTEDKVLILRAVGNAGPVVDTNFIIDLLYEDDPSVRSAAVDALRDHKDSSINDTILEFAKHDQSAEVRISALNTFKYRAMDQKTFSSIREIALYDSNPEMQVSALNIIKSSGINNATLNEISDQLIQSKPDESVINFLESNF